jgi:chemotaxis protein CheC
VIELGYPLSLTGIQLDALREVGNIGAGNAATALSKMLNMRVEMSVPEVQMLPISRVAATVGGADTYVAGIYLQITGSAPGSILFLLPLADARRLVRALLKENLRDDSICFGELGCSALVELGNIMTGSFLNALGMFTSLKYIPTVPSLCLDMVGAILGSVLHSHGVDSDTVFFIKTDFRYQGDCGVGYLFFLPEAEALVEILNSLGVFK